MKRLEFWRRFVRTGVASWLLSSCEPASAQLVGPTTAPSGAGTVVLKSAPNHASTSGVFDGLSHLTEAGSHWAQEEKMPKLAEWTGKGASALSGVSSYYEGLERGETTQQSIMRGIVGFTSGEAGAAALTAGFCIVTEGIGCAVVAAAGAIAGSYGGTGAYDYAADWINSHATPAEDKQTGQSESSIGGNGCIQWDEPGRPECGDGSRQPPSLPPAGDLFRGGGRAPAWTTIN